VVTWRSPSIVAVLVAAGVLVFVIATRRPETPVADLVAQFAQATKQPSDAAFEIMDVTIDGLTKRSIAAQEQTRLTYHVTVPARARFRVAIALTAKAWTRPSGGVLFLIGVSDGRAYRNAQSVVINPSAAAADRRWHDVTVNLDEYAGLTIDLILNTRATVAPADLPRLLAVWGAPTLVSR
jgi:hypothetical protein